MGLTVTDAMRTATDYSDDRPLSVAARQAEG